ncbi:MAG: hypothetical protein V7K32_05955 [Nostoc sp.]
MMLILVNIKVIQPNITVSDRNRYSTNGRDKILVIPDSWIFI